MFESNEELIIEFSHFNLDIKTIEKEHTIIPFDFINCNQLVFFIDLKIIQLNGEGAVALSFNKELPEELKTQFKFYSKTIWLIRLMN